MRELARFESDTKTFNSKIQKITFISFKKDKYKYEVKITQGIYIMKKCYELILLITQLN